MDGLTGVLSVILIDLVLSGDNALVIGMACAGLPPEQRRTGILYGSLAAIALRISMAVGAATLLRVPWLQAVGGILLLFIAYKLSRGSEESDHAIAPSASLWDAIRTVALADLVMSLDNVLAVGGVARENLSLLLFGLALTIPIIIWGSALVAGLLRRAPWLIHVGAAVLAWTAGAMIAENPALRLRSDSPLMPALACVLVLGVSAFDRVRRGWAPE
ncbi:MAG: TerC family protein [Bacillota bacterium]